jgi:C4-dicarboxylate transporter
MDMSKFSREELILTGVALLLAIDLLFLPWFDVTVGIGAFKASFTSSATGEPDGWLGVLAVLALIALIADLGLERLGNVALPAVNESRGDTRLLLAAVAAGFVVLKLLFHIHFDLFGIGFWGAVVLTAALVVTAVRARDAARMTPTLA